MKRNNLLKSLLLLASPIAITVVSISCTKPEIKQDPKPEVMNGGKQDNQPDKDPKNPQGSQTTPPSTGEKPNPEGEATPPVASGDKTPEKEGTPEGTPEGTISKPNEKTQEVEETIAETTPTDKPKENTNPTKQEEGEQQPKVDPQKELKDKYVKKLKDELEELIFYKTGNTKTQYDDAIKKYITPEAKFVDSNNIDKKIRFKLNVWNLKYLYKQVAELEEKFKDSISYEALLKYIEKEIESKDNTIFIKASDRNLPSIDYQKLNEVIFKLNAQAIANNTQSTKNK
ncbi:Uncharacterised protein [Mycoplasmopsis citelli]|uniref:Lipoprotein n=1 Tax=Mycoplasmopsis citelli TaxID=171281 RepID=A0A449B1C1_9BACT|nr:hypothetical protein [Mycoplasmopsis citelli]VEU74398.1 Uncharacterised protein [Mycoplasmopsis citelli]